MAWHAMLFWSPHGSPLRRPIRLPSCGRAGCCVSSATMRRSLLLALAHGSACLAKFEGENMNGEYVITPTPGTKAKGSFSTKWSEYPGGVEHFDAYLGPITTLYSQVWWKTLPTVKLPADLVKRFDKKAMAIVGYETDSVRKTPAGDVSVPINMAYNHHHDVVKDPATRHESCSVV